MLSVPLVFEDAEIKRKTFLNILFKNIQTRYTLENSV